MPWRASEKMGAKHALHDQCPGDSVTDAGLSGFRL